MALQIANCNNDSSVLLCLIPFRLVMQHKDVLSCTTYIHTSFLLSCRLKNGSLEMADVDLHDGNYPDSMCRMKM